MQTKKLSDFLPFLEWSPELKDKNVLKSDVIAGITVAMVLIPQSMAYAQLAGLPPFYGLYAAFIPVILSPLFGSSRQLATGPVAIGSIMTAAAIAPLGFTTTADYVTAAILLNFLAGLVQFFLGVFRLGMIVNFLSAPVLLGFTNAAALIIASSQFSKLLGVHPPKGEKTYETVLNVFLAAGETHLPTLSIAVGSIIALYLLKKLAPKFPGILVVVITSIFIAKFTGYSGNIVGEVPKGLPAFQIPVFDSNLLSNLFGMGVAIGLMGFMEAISIAKSMAVKTRQRIDANQELIGQGIAKIGGSFFQSYVTSGSFSRSAVNLEAKAVTGFSSIVTGVVAAIVLLWFTELLYYLPQATLAAVIIMAVIGLIDVKSFFPMTKSFKSDVFAALVTFGATLFFAPSLDKGILIGVGVSLMLYLYKTTKPKITLLSRFKDGTMRDAIANDLPTCEEIVLVRFDSLLYFANSSYFEEGILEIISKYPDMKVLILDSVNISNVDATGEGIFRKLSEVLEESDIRVMFARVKQELRDIFEQSGLLNTLGEENFYRHRDEAIQEAFKFTGKEHDDNACPLAPVKY